MNANYPNGVKFSYVNGKRVALAPRYGLCVDSDGVVRPDVAEQKLIERTQALRGEAFTYRAIADKLTEEGFTGRARGPVSITLVMRALQCVYLRDKGYWDHPQSLTAKTQPAVAERLAALPGEKAAQTQARVQAEEREFARDVATPQRYAAALVICLECRQFDLARRLVDAAEQAAIDRAEELGAPDPSFNAWEEGEGDS